MIREKQQTEADLCAQWEQLRQKQDEFRGTMSNVVSAPSPVLTQQVDQLNVTLQNLQTSPASTFPLCTGLSGQQHTQLYVDIQGLTHQRQVAQLDLDDIQASLAKMDAEIARRDTQFSHVLHQTQQVQADYAAAQTSLARGQDEIAKLLQGKQTLLIEEQALRQSVQQLQKEQKDLRDSLQQGHQLTVQQRVQSALLKYREERLVKQIETQRHISRKLQEDCQALKEERERREQQFASARPTVGEPDTLPEADLVRVCLIHPPHGAPQLEWLYNLARGDHRCTTR